MKDFLTKDLRDAAEASPMFANLMRKTADKIEALHEGANELLRRMPYHPHRFEAIYDKFSDSCIWCRKDSGDIIHKVNEADYGR